MPDKIWSLHKANIVEIDIRKRRGRINAALKLHCVCLGGCRKHTEGNRHWEYSVKFIQKLRSVCEEL